jgi:hypothetical protein
MNYNNLQVRFNFYDIAFTQSSALAQINSVSVHFGIMV